MKEMFNRNAIGVRGSCLSFAPTPMALGLNISMVGFAMKRHGDLWNELTSYRNLLRSLQRAARGKRDLPNVTRFRFHQEVELHRLQDELRDHTYQPGAYRTFEIFEPKRRMISAAPFRDRVVHHALCAVLEPIFEPTFIPNSYACRVGKGTHAAVDRFQQFARTNQFVLKCDLSKFFPSIDHELLKATIARKIKDPGVLWLVAKLIDHSNPQEPILRWFPGDDLLTPSEHRRGLPIGNQTSQFFANVFLNPLDHFVTEELHAKCYVRYVDDFVILSNDRTWLAEARDRCRAFLQRLRLTLHPDKSVVSRTRDGTRYLGYRVFPGHRLLAKGNALRMRRRLRHWQRQFARGALSLEDVRRRLVSWLGHAGQADTHRLCEGLLGRTLFRRNIA